MPAASVSGTLRARARTLRALLRLFWAAHLVAGLMLAQFCWPLLVAATPRAYFRALSLSVNIGVFFASVMLAALTGPRIAFLRTLALPRGIPRWLELGPPCAMVLVPAAAGAAFGRLPPITGLVTLGSGLWAIAMFSWFVRVLSLPHGDRAAPAWKVGGGVLLLASPALTVLVAAAARRSGGWPPAAAVALAMGLLGLVSLRFQSALHSAGGTSVPGLRAAPSASPVSGVSRAARSGDRAPSWFSTVRRLGLIDFSPWSIAVLAVIYGELAIGRVRASEMRVLAVNAGVYFGFKLGRAAHQPALLSMLPVGRAQMFVGRVLPWIVVPLVLPAMLLVKGEPALEILRMVLYVLVPLFSMASALMGHPVGARRLLRPLPGIAGYVIALASQFGWRIPAWLQTLWVLALLAGVCFAMWVRLLRSSR